MIAFAIVTSLRAIATITSVRLSTLFGTFGDRLQNPIVTGAGKCGLKQHMPKGPPSARNGSLTSHYTAITRHGREAGHGCGVTCCHLARFWQLCDQH